MQKRECSKDTVDESSRTATPILSPRPIGEICDGLDKKRPIPPITHPFQLHLSRKRLTPGINLISLSQDGLQTSFSSSTAFSDDLVSHTIYCSLLGLETIIERPILLYRQCRFQTVDLFEYFFDV